MEFLLRTFDDSITGFIYLAALFFFLLRKIEIKNLDSVKKSKEDMLYIAIMVVLFSQVIGFAAQFMLNHFINLFKCSLKSNVISIMNPPKIDENIIKQRDNIYASLNFYRHLLISSSLLEISLYKWLKYKDIERKKINLIIRFSIFIFVFLSICYLFIRYDLQTLNDAINLR